mmetsp:Transcript_6620/g.11103  ORF Transcript_6620/g.11103 Transcript_6620/m.11103 type:complete len:320 (+) Transcript_6620:82-1041(+)|eukprot:CAMPEP_0174990828 /NCGR_PEP_ID=MMETSP0004_2-20121128/21538_1 /TAXON_ID=420556 /ORGANISM="Ochromonas sp., Strain CCMP1393" /LENGTH=319 /DNA_ID=CAMNT_0016244479 /DNA_START=21 /DNA_END=980 /DNA_ORIENTATION=-
MGGDGGVIATKRAFVRGAKSDDKDQEQKSLKHHQVMRTRTCALSSELLQEPIVCCELGNLYNKEAVLQALLEKKLPSSFSHIRGLKDLKTLVLCLNPNFSHNDEVEGEMRARYSCPVTKMEFNSNHPFIVIWTTGHMLSEKIVRELGVEALQDEYGPFSADDLIKLIPLEDELDECTHRMVRRRNRKKALKAAAKQQQPQTAEESHGDNAISKAINEGDSSRGSTAGKKRKSVDSGENKISKSAGKFRDTAAIVGPSSSSHKITSISGSSSLVKNAVATVKDQQQQSGVFKGIFHNDDEKQKKDRDLFMSVAGLRYTVG